MAHLRNWFVLTVLRAFLVWAGPIFISAQVMAQFSDSLEIQNVAQRSGPEQWMWTAFVTGPSEQIAKIRCVRYTLHPTFPQPIVDVCTTSDARYPFGLTATGWGTFNIRARIYFNDGTSSDLTHFLEF